jgi:hypothetical protein
MISSFGYIQILGKPLIFYLGILTLIFFSVTAILGYLIHSGRARINIKWHLTPAIISLILALIHGLLAISAYL